MNNFGRHSALVEEVIAFVENRGVLRKPYRIVDEQVGMTTRTIYSLEDIDQFRDPDWPNGETKGDMAWLDIQRTDEHLFSSDWSDEFTKVAQPAIESIQKKMWEKLENQFADILPYHEIQEIDGFFHHLLYLRGANGHIESFDERLYKVYQAGGYPCGWAGSYPDGELIVYSRAESNRVVCKERRPS